MATVSLVLGLSIASGGCERRDTEPRVGDGGIVDGPGWRYQRGLTFLAREDGGIAAAPFAFRTSPSESRYHREARAWLARGATWDAFVEEAWSAPPVGGVWRMVPHGELRLAAGGSGVEALWYDSGGRRLRLDVSDPASTWQGGERQRFRLLHGRLAVGPEPSPGLVVEELQVSRRAAAGEPDIVLDRLVLVDENGFALYLMHERTDSPRGGGVESTAWTLAAGSTEAVQEGRVEWVEVRPFEEARRDIPLQWRFEAPESGVRGEISAVGYHPTLGLERGGRREIEVRYTVEGWLQRGDERVEVVGIVRHEQR